MLFRKLKWLLCETHTTTTLNQKVVPSQFKSKFEFESVFVSACEDKVEGSLRHVNEQILLSSSMVSRFAWEQNMEDVKEDEEEGKGACYHDESKSSVEWPAFLPVERVSLQMNFIPRPKQKTASSSTPSSPRGQPTRKIDSISIFPSLRTLSIAEPERRWPE